MGAAPSWVGTATARAGVAGNPSDALGGAALAVPVPALTATVTLRDDSRSAMRAVRRRSISASRAAIAASLAAPDIGSCRMMVVSGAVRAPVIGSRCSSSRMMRRISSIDSPVEVMLVEPVPDGVKP